MKAKYSDTITVNSTTHGDLEVAVTEAGGGGIDLYLSPKQARKLAKKLKRAAREPESTSAFN